jgi:hypothetical protein
MVGGKNHYLFGLFQVGSGPKAQDIGSFYPRQLVGEGKRSAHWQRYGAKVAALGLLYGLCQVKARQSKKVLGGFFCDPALDL